MEKETIKRLDAWYEMVKGEKELTIEEARTLNNLIRKLPPNRQELSEKLVLGTMHVVYSFLKSFSFIDLSTGVYDIDDFINAVCEVWIENLEQGLYHRSDFIELFNSRFFNKLSEKLGIEEKNCIFANITKNDFDATFKEFFDRKNSGEIVSYEDFIRTIELKNYNKFKNDELKTKLIFEYSQFYILLQKSYDLYSSFGNHNIPYSEGYIKFLRDFLIEKALDDYEDSYNVGYVYDGCDIIISKEKKEKIMEVVDSFPEREKQVLMLSFGFIDGERKTQEEIARYFGSRWTRQRIYQIEKDIKRKLRHPFRRKKLKDFVND